MFVTISEHQKNKTNRDKWEPLAIGAKSIAFLQKPLLERFHGQMTRIGESTFWHLKFFDQTEYKVELFVSFHAERPEKIKGVAKAVWQEVVSGQPSPDQVVIASKWLRGSTMLQLKDYEDRGDLRWSVDGAGFSIFSEGTQYARFERAVLLQALACAYRLRLQALINDLASWDSDPSRLGGLARRATEFNARCYFRHPVLMDRTELPYIWDKMVERMRLQSINAELLDQLHALHELIAADERERAAQERERVRSEMERARYKEERRWQMVSLAIALISAIQVVSLLPEAARVAWVIKFLNWVGIAL
jgi:hypothetical protein